MSLVSWPCRNSATSEPVSRNFPRAERSTSPAASRSRSYSVVAITRSILRRGSVSSGAMPLADDFQAALDTLPPDWSYFFLDMRIFDEERYIEAATILVEINAQ